ncbi:hypothetical protein JCM1840_001953 [Sporobolomyces johnsonii]
MRISAVLRSLGFVRAFVVTPSSVPPRPAAPRPFTAAAARLAGSPPHRPKQRSEPGKPVTPRRSTAASGYVPWAAEVFFGSTQGSAELQELVVAEDLAQVQLPNSAPSLEASPEPVSNPARRSSVLSTADSASSPAVTSFPSTSGPTPPAIVGSPGLASSTPTTASSSPELELATVRLAYETARRDGGATFHALNLELWELDQNVLLEFGWAILEYSKDAEGKVEERRTNLHVVIKENECRRNHQYVPDARDHFDFGHTLTLRLDALKSVLRALLASLSATSPVFLIFHNPNKDLRALAKLGFDVESEFECDLTRVPQRESGQGGVWVVDTQRLFEGWMERRGQVGLEKACKELEVPTKHLHNAGNDAHYTLDVFERLMDRSRKPSPDLIRWMDLKERERKVEARERMVGERERMVVLRERAVGKEEERNEREREEKEKEEVMMEREWNEEEERREKE